MEFDVTVIASLIGVAGLAFAALLSSIGYLYRGLIESKRSARKVLYILLEIRYALSASLFNADKSKNEYIRHYADRLKAKGIEVNREDIDAQIGSMIENHFNSLAKAAKTDIKERLIQPFEEALSELSQISPVLAYRLRGKEKLELIAKLNSSYLDSFKDNFIDGMEAEWAKLAIVEFAEEIENEAIKSLSGKLDQEVIILSKRCGWKDSYECRRVLSAKFGEFDKEVFLELDKLIDKLIKKMTAAANK
ncbi:hypothetical protein [Simiduia aestuariiviva]|uniref:Uncharacterized protein n=1 Tax=Simiduia aestuariiviva TaxID=1510459 RepID=A0A839UP38_9GAMM|nr:hypothetical protein [Simiduia aestuariiviva]MBB3169964.1 hypothetical protein [Simiduia aestuariiviva]